MGTKTLIVGAALWTVQSCWSCSSPDYSRCTATTIVVPVDTDGGAPTPGPVDGGAPDCGACPSTHDEKPFLSCDPTTLDGGAPGVACTYALLCGA